MPTPRILAFAGSARRKSFNKRLIKIAVRGAEAAGAQVTLIDLGEYPLPIMDQDLEAARGLPENALALKTLFLEHDGLLMSCPEYNSSVTPLWKNTIDWVSRQAPGEASLAAYQGKVSAIMSASPGGLGGLRGLVHVRAILSNIGVLVIPQQVALREAPKMFAVDGTLNDAKQQSAVENLGKSLAEIIRRLKG
jgi:NAD(P)H-dependent FMN reductase